MTYNFNAQCATFKLKCFPIVSECWPCTTQSIRKLIGSFWSLSCLNPYKLANTNFPSRVLSLLVILWWCPESLQYPDVSLGLVVIAASRYVGYFNSFTLSCTVSAFYAQSRSFQEFLALLFSVSQHWELCPLCLFHVAWIWLLAELWLPVTLPLPFLLGWYSIFVICRWARVSQSLLILLHRLLMATWRRLECHNSINSPASWNQVIHTLDFMSLCLQVV